MISIVVPIYNAEQYLVDCVNSILNQSYQDFELILVNDGSKDNSLEICKSFCNDKIKIIDKINGGVSSARNAGIINALGDYILFIDSDDIIPNNCLQTLMEAIDCDIDMVFGPFVYKYENGREIKHQIRLTDGVHKCDNLKENFVDDGTLSGFLISSSCGVLYRKSIIESRNIRFNEELRINEDGLFNLEYILNSNQIKVLDDSVYTVKKHDDSSTHTRSVSYDFDAILKEYIFSKGYQELISNLSLQFKRRKATLALFDILIYPKQYSFSEAYRFIKNKINDNDVRNSLTSINVKALKSHKLLMYFLMRYRCSLLLLLNSVYIIPFLNSRVSR